MIVVYAFLTGAWMAAAAMIVPDLASGSEPNTAQYVVFYVVSTAMPLAFMLGSAYEAGRRRQQSESKSTDGDA